MGKNTKCIFFALLLVVVVTALAGCGKSNKKSTSPAGAPGVATSVGAVSCTTCHSDIVTSWLASRHANLENGNLYSAGNPTTGQVQGGTGCTPCHDPLGESQHLGTSQTGYTARPVIGCESCHGGASTHINSGGPMTLAALASGLIGTVPVSAQFNTCTTCHELLDSAGTGTSPNPAHAATAPTGTQYVITDTHFAVPGDWLPSPSSLSVHNTAADYVAIFGYAMDYADEKVCTNCHNPHVDPTINREWALSAHADRQGVKMDPRSSAPVGTYSFSSAWAHYNWSSRSECQRCHTTTGFAAYADALRTGNAAQALGIRLGTIRSIPTNTYFKPEMLKCNGCHTNTQGGLRNPGAITADYSFVSGSSTYAVVSHTYPDLGGSNVCMACHTGRESGDSIKGLNDPSLLTAGTITSVNFSNRQFINSHYLAAGGTVFRVTGYTFANRSYDNPTVYLHDKIGSASAPDTGSNGPCIGCHMSRPNNTGNHLFLPVVRDGSGHITAIASQACAKCHGPNDMTAMVEGQRTLYKEALEALQYDLEQKGYYFADASPYFYQLRANGGTVTVTQNNAVVTLSGTTWSGVTGTTFPNSTQDRFRLDADGHYYAIQSLDNSTQITLQANYLGSNATGSYTIIGTSVKNWLTSPDTDTTGNQTGKNNMGAAFNFNLLEHDPGAYAHNRYYTKRLIYDSLDWLDDNQMNYSVGTTLSAQCSAAPAPTWCAGAMEYLLPNGVFGGGVAAERP